MGLPSSTSPTMLLEQNKTGAKLNRGRQRQEGRRTREKYSLDKATGFDGTPGDRPQVGCCGPVGKAVARGLDVSLPPAAYGRVIQGMSPSQGSAPSARRKCRHRAKGFFLLEVGLPVHVAPIPTGGCGWCGLPVDVCLDPVARSDCCHCQTRGFHLCR